MWETIYRQLRARAPERLHNKVPARFLIEKVERVCELGNSDARARQVGAILSQRLNI